MRHESILDTVGRTPAVRIRRLAPTGAKLYVKLEAFNPMGSVKDRLALGIIEDAERSGALQPGQTVIEATSGNTGIGLAMVCAAKGYPLVVTMAENFSVERRKLMRFLGAKVVLTPAAQKGSGMLAKAVRARRDARLVPVPPVRERSQRRRAFAHDGARDPRGLRRRAARLLRHRLRHRRHAEGRRARAAQASVRARVSSSASRTTRRCSAAASRRRALADGTPAASHPLFRPHLMQGWSPDFIPKLTEDAVALGLVDEIVPVRGADALRLARELATEEGIFVGISSGATLAGALEVARDAAARAPIVLCMLPDTGERYLSTPLFADIAAEMTDEELALSRSTPGQRFDAPPPPVAAAQPAAAVGGHTRGGELRREAIADPSSPS